MYLAHSLKEIRDESQWHTLQDHLVATGDLASDFATAFGAQNAAKIAGLLHDLGKYSAAFQARLRGATESVDHAAAGSQEVASWSNGSSADKITAQLIAYAIAGHHAGLADFSGFQERLKKRIEPIDECWRNEIALDTNSLWPRLKNLSKDKSKAAFQLAFLGRMIFSCLVDADYKDTEKFYTVHEQRVVDRLWPDLKTEVGQLIYRFNSYMAAKRNDSTSVNILRSEILTHVRSKATDATGLFTLTVPTGGGKTLASLGFALDHAQTHHLRRIIYAIPFTSIIDQTASIFRSVLGDDVILEHHSSIDQNKFTGREEQRDKLKLAMEDWAAPIVVTTNVQLFESLFANRPSHCRKLHNLANSVIILDEAQTLPLTLLRPCLQALDELAQNYNTTIVLCTATQPALDITDFPNGGLALQGRELAPDPALLAQKLKRVHITKSEEIDDDALVAALQKHEQALVIVNSRRHALALYEKAKQTGTEGVIHLTTRQHATHRRQILAQVRLDLNDKNPCRLIATSLVEAGVDLDFPRVWRAEAGLDQIAQAAGRCNREGKRPIEDSVVTVFRPKDHRPPREIAQLAAAYSRIAEQHDDLLSPEAIRAYFKEVFWQKGLEQLDRENILACFTADAGGLYFDYQTAAQKFKLIESGLVPIIINDSDDVEKILGRLTNEAASPGMAARELQSHIVQIPPHDRQNLIANARVAYHYPELWGDQFVVLKKESGLYTKETGLIWENADVLTGTIF
jgi:CRISPR-associated endonuclease/helicase Cas3